MKYFFHVLARAIDLQKRKKIRSGDKYIYFSLSQNQLFVLF